MASSSRAALALILGCLLAAPASAAEPKVWRPPRKSFAWPTPDLLEETELPGVTWTTTGMPVILKAVHLKHRQHELLQLYADAFYDAGFYVPPDKDQVKGPGIMLTALDTRTGISYSAIFTEHPDRTTTILLGEANTRGQRPPGEADGQGPPAFPSAQHVVRSTSEVGRALAFDAPASCAAVLDFYLATLRKQGYVQRDPKLSPNVFTRGKSELEVSTRADAEKACSVAVSEHGG